VVHVVMAIAAWGSLLSSAHIWASSAKGSVGIGGGGKAVAWLQRGGAVLGTLVPFFPVFLPILEAVIGIILWHIEWKTGLPFDVAECSAVFSTLLTLTAMLLLLHPRMQRGSATVPAALIAQNEAVNLGVRTALRFLTRPKLQGIASVVPGRFGLLVMVAAAMYHARKRLQWKQSDTAVYSTAWVLILTYEQLHGLDVFNVGGMHILATAFYLIMIAELLRGLQRGGEYWRLLAAINLVLFFLWQRSPERQVMLFVLNYQYIYLLVPASRWVAQMERPGIQPQEGRGSARLQPEVCVVAMLLFNQCLHDYGQAYGYNFKPDVDPFTAVGVFNFNESPLSAASMMAFSKTGALYLGMVYVYLAQGGAELPLVFCVATAAVDGIILHEMVWRYMMSSRLIDVALHTVAVSSMGLVYIGLMALGVNATIRTTKLLLLPTEAGDEGAIATKCPDV